MDILSLLGIVLALVSVLVGAVLKGAGLHALVSSAAFTIVVLGTMAAVMIQTPMATMRRAFAILPWVLSPPAAQVDELIANFVDWANRARRTGLLGLDSEVDSVSDDFLRKGLMMVIDGAEPDAIRHSLEVDIAARESADSRAAKVFEGMGIYAPTLGIIGAVLGLMAVMQNLADPSKLGHGIAAAFTATIYGIGLANLLFLPIANKLKTVVQLNSHLREMMIEGLLAVAQGENPRRIESRLQSYGH